VLFHVIIVCDIVGVSEFGEFAFPVKDTSTQEIILALYSKAADFIKHALACRIQSTHAPWPWVKCGCGCSDGQSATATTLVGPSIKHGVLGGYILKKRRKRTEIRLKSCISSMWNGRAI